MRPTSKPDPVRRRTAMLLAVLAALVCLSVTACGGGSDAAQDTTTTAATLPGACAEAPVTVDLRAEGDRPAGSEAFDATHAVALRTPILPGEMAFDGSGLAALQSKAEITPLAVYTLYLSDFVVDNEELSGRSKGAITPPEGKTLGMVRIVPATEDGFTEGDTVVAGALGYETNSSLVPLTLTVLADANAEPMASTDVEGRVKVLALTDDQLCLDVDVTVRHDDAVVYAVKGTVAAPIVRSEPAYFFT